MTGHPHWHPLFAVGSALTGLGALLHQLAGQYGPALFGFALTVFGLWLQGRENRRHEAENRRHEAAMRPGRGPDAPKAG